MNSYRFNSREWRAYERGSADTNTKWRQAIAGKLPASSQPPSSTGKAA